MQEEEEFGLGSKLIKTGFSSNIKKKKKKWFITTLKLVYDIRTCTTPQRQRSIILNHFNGGLVRYSAAITSGGVRGKTDQYRVHLKNKYSSQKSELSSVWPTLVSDTEQFRLCIKSFCSWAIRGVRAGTHGRFFCRTR